ncbi:MAG: MarC family protein [Methanocalculus sp. MSAO_Arc1]|uniref:MarC family protein n=1 Tax=Methanocalculus TaxID=71151 RepID=UPI000FEE3EF8|nr:MULTISPECIES: MarC family protein [unclassified Methanocalculus]MCP1663086.1 multiple antibiotic resistance protein [Methanocalculus sp. AMF5]RQD81758.1 MAG: MarC family protein [Methanocalculus sp. MSAO_Arc1]
MPDFITFMLLSASSIFIVINPLAVTLIYVTLTEGMDLKSRLMVVYEANRVALLVILLFAIAGGAILQLFGISLEAFRVAGGILLFGIGMEMVYAKTSRTKMTATEKYEGIDADDIGLVPLAIPMIAGPGTITTVIVLMNEASDIGFEAMAIVPLLCILVIVVNYYMMKNAELITKYIGPREYRVIGRLMGMMLLAIAVQFVLTGLQKAFPFLVGGL